MTSMAERITTLRNAKGLNRVELATALGLPRLTIEKYESGRITPPKDTQEKLAAFFDVSLAYLRCETDDNTGMGSWLSGNVPEEPPTSAPPVVKVNATKQAEAAKDGAVFNLLLKSDAFKNAVLEVLKSPEGKRLIEQATGKKL